MDNRPIIASISLGQVRSFQFRSVDDHRKRYALPLAHGSLLLMKGAIQLNWEHRIAKSTRSMGARINLTFRQINERS
ncbi:alpha-ketoglutarate-dependent dioxygenase AlkB [Pedobacter sp.]